jgi:PAS domain S-box-containing protein
VVFTFPTELILDKTHLPPSHLDLSNSAPKPPAREVFILGVLLILAVLFTGAVLGCLSAARLAHFRDKVVLTHSTIASLETLLSTLKDAETGQRGYLLTHDKQYLVPYQKALGRVQTQSTAIKSSLTDNAQQSARFLTLEQTIARKLVELKGTIDLADKDDLPAAVARVRQNVGKNLMDEIRTQIDEMETTERQILESQNEKVRNAYRTTLVAIIAPAVIAIVLVILIFVLFQRITTQRRLAADALFEQKERLRTTLASIGDGVIITDPKGNVTNLNAVAVQLTGWSNQDAVGLPLNTVFNIVNETSRKTVENPVVRALRDGVIVGLANHTILIAKDTAERHIDDSAAPIRREDGEIIGCVLIFRDIGEQRRAERVLKETAESLRRLTAELSEADRRKDEFIAMLAHELRNPLAPIRNGLQIMRLAREDASAVENARAMMERQLGHMVRLVDDLLDISRISRGKLQLRKERIDLATVINNAIETSRPLIEAGAHRLTVALPPSPVYIDADVTRLGQVFANLLNNAAKYSNRGGHIDITAHNDDVTVVVSVKDTGIGIPPPCSPSSSKCSPRSTVHRNAPRAALASVSHWSNVLSKCTAAPLKPKAPAAAQAANFSSASPSSSPFPRPHRPPN